MPPCSPAPRRALLALGACALLTACRGDSPSASPPPPPAEFVLAAGDSAFWVTSAGGAVHVRGAPLELARVDGKFYELYVADEDHSYGNAVFIGQRVYRRDLVTGDSLLLYEEPIVPKLAREYARTHPNDERLAPDDEPPESPRWSVTSTLDLGEVQGPFVSYALHADVQRDDAEPWHTSRRGVLDLRHGGLASLDAVAGRERAAVEQARAASLAAALDSVSTASGVRAPDLRPIYRPDPTSFSLTTVDGGPAVAFAVPGSGAGDAGRLLPLAPIRIGEPAWWAEASSTLPVGSADGGRDVWRHDGYEVVVRYDSLSGAARLAIRDNTSREWMVGRVPAPATRIFWLDRPALDSAGRRALSRAFDESSLYDEAVRTASFAPRAPARRPLPSRPRRA